ncbi:MAG: STAS/SEC14 domain-containing protein [Desulfobacteraceae bacterium]|jgi:hypothetical protein
MIGELKELGPNIIGFRIEGSVSDAETERISSAIQKLAGRAGKVRLLLAAQHYPSFNSAEDLYFDLRVAVPLADRIERLAVVGDRVWKDTWISLFGLFSGIQAAYFDRSEMNQAWQWLSAA